MKLHQFQGQVCRFLVIASLALGILRADEKFSWENKEIRGESYVSVEQIGKFYRLGEAVRDGSSVTLDNGKILMKLEIGSTVCHMNTVKVILSKPVAESENSAYVSGIDLAVLVEPILRPDRIAATGDLNTVILDPDNDPAISNELGTGGEFTLMIADMAKKQLEGKGFTVVLTRNKNQVVSPEERVDLANEVEDSAVFVSISFNTGTAEENGIQTFAVARGKGVTETDPFGMANVALSTAIHAAIVERLGANTSDGGLTKAEPGANSRIKHPAVLVKPGFMSHERDARLIANATYQTAVAEGIVDGIVRYRYAVRRKDLIKSEDVSVPD